MRHEVALTEQVNEQALRHLLQHYQAQEDQEDLCFATWRPSTGQTKQTALLDDVILPNDGERQLHGNASFEPNYLARAIQIARKRGAGLAFMHSHPAPGFQSLSRTDAATEGRIIERRARATRFPLVGLTVGADEYWSARVWQRDGSRASPQWCDQVRVIGPHRYAAFFNDRLVPVPKRQSTLRRTYDTLGTDVQQNLARMRIGVVGLGSVGSIVSEALGRIGVSRITLIDHDIVEPHNLDRMLFATAADADTPKVSLAERALRRHATAAELDIKALAASIQDADAYRAALDCDVLFSCVDRPTARDVMNHIAYAHLIPVIDGGISVWSPGGRFRRAHWRAHLVAPGRECMRCNEQYSTAEVVIERDGSLDDPSYDASLPVEDRQRNENVFSFSLSLASMEVNRLLHYVLRSPSFGKIYQQDYQFNIGEIETRRETCHPNCRFPGHVGQGDSIRPPYVILSDQ